MKSILMTSSAAALVALSAGAAQAECPEDIDSFNREFEAAMGSATAGDALSASEQAELFGLRTTAENLYRSGNLEMCAQAIQRAQLMLDTAIAPTALQPAELVGMDVRNSADEYLGEVEDITVDPISGRIAYVLVEHGGFLGIGDNLTPVPWRSITYAPGADSLLLDITEDRLENAPQLVDDETSAQERRAWLLSMHDYYGVEPYWQDTIASMAVGTGAPGEASGAAPADAAAQGDEASGVVAVPVEVESVTMTEGAGQEPREPTEATRADGTAAAEARESEATAEETGATPPAAGTAAGTETGGDNRPVLVGEQPAGGAQEDLSMLTDRIEALENRIEELSDRGVGDQVRQAIADLEEQVQQLAQQRPGEDVRAAIAGLEEQVRQLAGSQPGEEVREAIASLENRMQELAESRPGTELRQMIGRLETEVRELAGRPRSAEPAPLGAVDQEASPPTAGTDADIGRSGVGDTAGADGELPATAQPTASAGAPEQGRADEPATGAQAAGGQAARQQDADGEVQQMHRQTDAEGRTIYSTVVPPAETDLNSPAGGGDTAGQAALGGSEDRTERCESGITRLEEDLARAQELGLAIDDARSELEAAQAMLRRDSEALCRAAIKRAREGLVAQGFEPTQAN